MIKQRLWAATAVLGLMLAACGGDSGIDDFGGLSDPGQESGNPSSEGDSDEAALEEFAEAVNEAQGAGGGGTLTFDGVEYVIDSAVCVTDGERIDVGTIGSDGYRVFVSGPGDDPNLQILTPEGEQRFDGDTFGQNRSTVTIDGDTITATGGQFFSNQTEGLIAVEFTIQCPQSVL